MSRLHIVTPSGDYRYTLVGYPSLEEYLGLWGTETQTMYLSIEIHLMNIDPNNTVL